MVICDPTNFQKGMVFLSLYLIALGTGGIKPCVSSFGADQFDESEKKNKASFFNWFYLLHKCWCFNCFFCASVHTTQCRIGLGLWCANSNNGDCSCDDCIGIRNLEEVQLLVFFRCYFNCEDIDSGVKIFEEYTRSRLPFAELYAEKMHAKGIFLNPKVGSDLLLAAAGEKTGGYTTANYIWDLCQSRRINPTFPAVKAYYEGLKERQIPPDDPRLVTVGRTYDDLNFRFGGRRNRVDR